MDDLIHETKIMACFWAFLKFQQTYWASFIYACGPVFYLSLTFLFSFIHMVAKKKNYYCLIKFPAKKCSVVIFTYILTKLEKRKKISNYYFQYFDDNLFFVVYFSSELISRNRMRKLCFIA